MVWFYFFFLTIKSSISLLSFYRLVYLLTRTFNHSTSQKSAFTWTQTFEFRDVTWFLMFLGRKKSLIVKQRVWYNASISSVILTTLTSMVDTSGSPTFRTQHHLIKGEFDCRSKARSNQD